MTTGGDDFISARINFEMPPEATAQMRELNTELDRFRTNTEAAARGVDSFMRYIQLLNDAQERASQSSRNLASNLERVLQLQERQSGGQGTAVPQMYSTPWEASAPGMGGGERDRGPIPTTVPTGGSQTMFDHLAANDPRAYLNARAAWGSPSGQRGEQMPQVSIDDASLDRLARRTAERDHQQSVQESKQPAAPGPGGGGGQGSRSGAPQTQPWEAWRNRAAQWTGTAGNIASGLGVGGSLSGMASRAGHALSGWGARMPKDDPSIPGGTGGTAPTVQPTPGGGEEPSVPTEGQTDESVPPGAKGGGGMAGLGKAMGFAGAGLTAGAGAFAAYKGIGGEIQQYRALGQMRGGGFEQGFGYEMQARMMAMNPFIKTEQARQIMQSALTEGYTGKEFDTVTEFMAHNLKDMNLSVADSTKLLHESVRGTGKSAQEMTEALTNAQESMKTMSQFGSASLPGRQKDFGTAFGAAVNQGMDPTEAAKLGVAAGQMFQNKPAMAGMGGDIMAAAENSMQFQYMAMSQGGVDPKTVPGFRADDPTSFYPNLPAEQKTKVFWTTMQKMARNYSQHGNMLAWMGLLDKLGIPYEGRKDAQFLYDEAMAYGSGSKDDPGANLNQTYTTKKDPLAFNLGDAWGKSLPGRALHGLGDLGKGAANFISPGMGDSISSLFSDHSSLSGSDIASRAANMFGGNAEVGGGDKWSAFDPGNQQQIDDLKSGKLHIRKKGESGEGITVDQLKDSGGGNADSALHGKIDIQVHPASMRSVLGVPQFIPITSNEIKAKAGFGNSTMNTPDPGDGVISRGSR